jgi:CHAD domain-containing protein
MAAGRKIEIEMKYEVAKPQGGDRYLVAPEIGSFVPRGPVSSNRVVDTYVDSADWALARAGFAARMRKTSHGTAIGLKGLNVSGGRLQRREEIEGATDAGLDPRHWPSSPARDVVMELCGDEKLVEFVTISQLRRVRKLQSGDTRVELSLDDVEILGPGGVLEAFEELEAELRRGPEAPLAELVAVFDRDADLTPTSQSKLSRAVAALGVAMPSLPDELRRRWLSAPTELMSGTSAGAPGGSEYSHSAVSAAQAGEPVNTAAEPLEFATTAAASAATSEPAATEAAAIEVTAPRHRRVRGAGHVPVARTIGIVADDTMSEAALKVLRFHLGRMQRREAGTRSGIDAEDLHDMRVATRRMRAAWRVFDGAFKAGKTKKLRRQLEAVADRLGAVRDLDVLIEGLEAYSLGMDEPLRPGLEPLLSVWRRQRSAARVQLIGELDSDRYASFLRDMTQFVEAGANSAVTLGGPLAPHRVRDRAASEIWSAYETIRAYELVLPWADVETLHELRIATKWLRYALEFFCDALGPDGPRLLTRVVAMQDHLGSLHDADVASKLVRDLLVARAGHLSATESEVIGSYLHSREREVARRRRGLGPIWRAVDGAPFRRALGRATAAL